MISRRRLLRGAGGVSIALPWLEAMRPARAAGKPPKRFIVFFTPNGTIHSNWRPFTDGAPDRGQSPAKASADVARFAFGDGRQMRILAPLERWKQDLVVIDGLEVPSRRHGPGANGHDKGMGHMLTGQILRVGPSGIGDFSHLPDGTAGGPSIDQVIAQANVRRGTSATLPSLELGVLARLDRKRQLTSRMCYRGPFQVVPPESDPLEAFRGLFAGQGGSAAMKRLGAQRRSVLDGVLDDFRTLAAQVGAEDRAKLEAHVGAVREIEAALTVPDDRRPSGCVRQTSDVPATIDAWNPELYPQLGRLQMDLLVQSLACDVTRVASLQWSTGQSNIRFKWLGIDEDHHGLSHLADDKAEVREKLTRIDHWYAQQFEYLLSRMAQVREGDGTLLDHSLVMWVNEQGNGDQHSEREIPYVLAGRLGGALKTGRYLRRPGLAANDLYVSLLRLFGEEDATTFGLPEVCRGPLPGLV